MSAHHKDWTRAETEAKAVLTLPAHENDARRLLALIYAVRAQKNPALASKAMEQAKLVSVLSGEKDWSSQMIMAMASYTSNDFDKARDLLNEASANATDENRVFCDDLAFCFESKETFSWNFLRR